MILKEPKLAIQGLLGRLMYKNRLQEYTQKSGLPLPEYQIRDEGFQHAPKFRSHVLVNGEIYVSRGTFPRRKEAEQDAARVALEYITEVTKDEECSLIHLDPTFCKLILNEYAVKMKLQRPEYKTTTEGVKRPVFISTLVFDGRVYKGEVGRSKKMAEQLAANVAIRSLLETGSEVLHHIIKSKGKANDSVSKVKNSSLNSSPVEANKKVTKIMPSNPNLKCEETIDKYSGENKRKPEAGGWEQKKLQCHEWS